METRLAVMSQKGSAAKAAEAVKRTGKRRMPPKKRLLRNREQKRASRVWPRAVEPSTATHWTGRQRRAAV